MIANLLPVLALVLFAFDGGHRHINATEMVGVGVVAAAFVVLVGYVILRRRSSTQA
jgi:uncharacterized membrane protein